MRDLAQAANFAAFTVHLQSGAAMTHVMWVDADDDRVLVNTEVHRAKFKAVERDRVDRTDARQPQIERKLEVAREELNLRHRGQV